MSFLFISAGFLHCVRQHRSEDGNAGEYHSGQGVTDGKSNWKDSALSLCGGRHKGVNASVFGEKVVRRNHNGLVMEVELASEWTRLGNAGGGVFHGEAYS